MLLTSLPSQARLKEILHYCPTSGVFIWKVKPAKQIAVGAVAGHPSKAGYIQIRLNGKLEYAHRLAFLYMLGKLPAQQVDHINGDRTDTSWGNLREVDSLTNRRNAAKSKNNASGVTGVMWEKRRKLWQATIMVNHKTKFLGYFTDKNDAIAIRKQAEQDCNFHPNHGR